MVSLKSLPTVLPVANSNPEGGTSFDFDRQNCFEKVRERSDCHTLSLSIILEQFEESIVVLRMLYVFDSSHID